MARKKRPKQPWWKPLWALVDRKYIVTYLVVVALGGIGYGGKLLFDGYQQRKTQRTNISEEIYHRIPIARQHALGDVNLAKKYLDGVDPRYCRHEQYFGVPLRTLLDDWQSVDGAKIDPEIDRLAVDPSPTPEQLQNLLALLDKAFPQPTAIPTQSGIAKQSVPRDESKPARVADQPPTKVNDKLPSPPRLPRPALVPPSRE